MAIQTIQYQNKVALNTNPEIADINKCNASDMNEIKSVVNNNANNIGDLSNLETSDTSSLVDAINSTVPKVLWQNNNTTTNFAAQTVTLSEPIENFRYYTAIFIHATDNTFSISTTAKVGYNARVSAPGAALMNNRSITNISGTSCTFSDNKEYPTYGGSDRTANNRLIPFQIIGHY